MVTALLNEVDELRTYTNAATRITVSELARGKGWREDLPERGIIEVTDRTQTIGWLLSDERVNGLLALIDELTAELEERQVRDMLAARAGYQDWRVGDDLERTALESLDKRVAAMGVAARGC